MPLALGGLEALLPPCYPTEGGYFMRGTKQVWLGLIALVVCPWTLLSWIHADETPQAIIQTAIKAHGGEKNLAKTLTGTLTAKATMLLAPNFEVSVSWKETFELPRRYHRRIKGQIQGKDFSMEYGITEGSGWIRRNGGESTEF